MPEKEGRELAEPEELYRNMIELSPDGIVTADLKGVILLCNKAGLRISGYSEDELVGKHFSKIGVLSLRDMPKYLKILGSCLRGKTPKPFEITAYRKDGTTFLAEVNVGLLRVGGKKIIQGVVRDTTERKRMEKELKESEERYRNLVQNALDIIFTVSLDGTITSLNPAFETITGWASSEWVGKPFASLIHPDDLPLAMKLFQGAIQQKASGTLEARIIAKSGEYLQMEVKSTPLTQNERMVGFWSIARNLTERKRVEEALRESEERYKALFEQKLEGVIIIDKNMKVLLANQAATQMFAFNSVEELSGANPFDFIPPEERERVLRTLTKDMFEHNLQQINEFRLINKAGEEIWISAVGTLIEYQGKPVGLVSFRDVTERKQAEAKLVEMREQLVRSERLAAIGQLAGGIGHELRNPLGAIKNAAYYIKGKIAKSELAQKEPKVMEFLNIMDDEINASTKIINDLLGFSRVGKPSVSPTQIKNVIEDALSRTPIPENIKLIKELDAELPQVEIDASQIQQVLVNLIINAVQAMPEGGKLITGAREKEGFVGVEIADTGCGIPQEAIDKIFDPLFTTKAKGIGLGLAVCKAIIDRHEGKIEVKSQVGKGTTFIIRLPLK